MKRKKEEEDKDRYENTLNKVGRFHKFQDRILLLRNGQEIKWTKTGVATPLSDIEWSTTLPEQYGSHCRIGKSIRISRIEGCIALKPSPLASFSGEIDNLRTLIVYDRCPVPNLESAQTISTSDVLKNFDLRNNDFSSDSYSNYNVDNSDRFKILFDDRRELYAKKESDSITTLILGLMFAKTITSSIIKFDIKNLDLLCEFDDNRGVDQNATSGVIYLLTIGLDDNTTFTGDAHIRIYFDDELAHTGPYIQYY